jgi:hypothetical protein
LPRTIFTSLPCHNGTRHALFPPRCYATIEHDSFVNLSWLCSGCTIRHGVPLLCRHGASVPMRAPSGHAEGKASALCVFAANHLRIRSTASAEPYQPLWVSATKLKRVYTSKIICTSQSRKCPHTRTDLHRFWAPRHIVLARGPGNRPCDIERVDVRRGSASCIDNSCAAGSGRSVRRRHRRCCWRIFLEINSVPTVAVGVRMPQQTNHQQPEKKLLSAGERGRGLGAHSGWSSCSWAHSDVLQSHHQKRTQKWRMQ